MIYRSAYTTVDAVLRQLATDENSEYNTVTQIDTLRNAEYANAVTRIKDLIYDQSRRVAQLCQQTFIPYTWTYAPPLYRAHGRLLDAHVGYYHFHLDGTQDDLLSIDSLTWGSTALTAAQYRVGDGLTYPARHVEIDDDVTLTLDTGFTAKATLVGTWGYHENPDAMWTDSGDTPSSSVTASATSVTVSSGGNFEVYQYILWDDEMSLITGISTNTLTLERGVNGTTATTHAADATMYTFQPHDLAESAVRRRVVYLLNNPGESRRIVPLPDGTVELDDENSMPLPPKRATFGRV